MNYITKDYAAEVLAGNMSIEVSETLPIIPTRYKVEVSEYVNNKAEEILEYIRNKKWEEIKKARNDAETSGCPFKDKILDSDQRSVTKINVMIEAAKQVGESFTIEWTMQDNSVLTLTYEDALSIPLILAQYSNLLHEKARIYREQIYNETNIKNIMNIKWEV